MDSSDLHYSAPAEGVAAIDRVFASFICEQAGTDAPPLLWKAAALASLAVRSGNSCCELAKYASGASELEQMADALRSCAGKNNRVVALYSGSDCGAMPAAPLVLDDDLRLYLNRYFRYEQRLKEQILQRCRERRETDMKKMDFPGISLRFAANAGAVELDCQQLAVYTALKSRFSVITGGPGTGKTTVASVLLALKLMENPDLKIVLCAPTGKAQARLKDAVTAGNDYLKCDKEIKEKLQALPCSTIHRLLGYRHNSTQFIHNRKNPLPADLLLVDEVSMVSLPLMSKLLDALKADAEVVLMGDKDQLSAVEAGSVLADLCASGECNVLLPDSAAEFRALTGWEAALPGGSLPLSGCIAGLVKNYRSANAPLVTSVAEKLRTHRRVDFEEYNDEAGDFYVENISGDLAPALKKQLELRCIELENDPEKHAFAELPRLAASGSDGDFETAFSLIEKFKVLGAVREGRRGVKYLNELICNILQMNPQSGEVMASGTPVMITQNRPKTGLYNGDIGMAWRLNGRLRVFFRNWEQGGFVSFLPSELPEYETVFAMTVHKSQGSGFQNVLTVLPDRDMTVLTRELLYTAITRAEKRCILWGKTQIINAAVQRQTRRQSGLAKRLAGEGNTAEKFQNPEETEGKYE